MGEFAMTAQNNGKFLSCGAAASVVLAMDVIAQDGKVSLYEFASYDPTKHEGVPDYAGRDPKEDDESREEINCEPVVLSLRVASLAEAVARSFLGGSWR